MDDEFYVNIDLYAIVQNIIDVIKHIIDFCQSIAIDISYVDDNGIGVTAEPTFWVILIVFFVIDLVVFAVFRDYPD